MSSSPVSINTVLSNTPEIVPEIVSYTPKMNWRKQDPLPSCNANEFVDRLRRGEPTYEVTCDNGKNKIYIDLDYQLEPEQYSADIARQIKEEGERFMPTTPFDITIEDSHSGRYFCDKLKKDSAKYSVHYFVPILATKSEIKQIVNAMNRKCADTKNKMHELMDGREIFDSGVYDTARKIRCHGTSKKGENRPLQLVKGSIEGTVITAFNVGLPELVLPPMQAPAREVAPTEAPAREVAPTSSNPGEVEAYIRAGLERGMHIEANGYNTRLRIAFILIDAMGADGEDLFVEWYRPRASFTEEGARAKYKELMSAPKPGKGIGIGTLIKLYKDTYPEIAKQIIRTVKKSMRKCEIAIPDCLKLYNEAFTTGLIADVFADICGDKWIYSHGSLYHYNGVFWERKSDKRLMALHNYIDTEFQVALEIHADAHLERSRVILAEAINRTRALADAHIDIPPEQSIQQQKAVQILRKICQRKQLVEDVLNKIARNVKFDTNPMLFAFTNCIFNLNTSEKIPEHIYHQAAHMQVTPRDVASESNLHGTA